MFQQKIMKIGGRAIIECKDIYILDQELIPYRYSSCSSCQGDLFKKASLRLYIISNQTGMNFLAENCSSVKYGFVI